MKNILIIDDEEKFRHLLVKLIKLEGFEVFQAADLKSGFKNIQNINIDVILCDVKLPDGNGVDFVKKIKTTSPVSEIILMTAFGKISDKIQAIKNGAFDYIVKADDNDKIIPLLYKALEKRHLYT
ncbi:response regulator [Flavobacterium pectinovorum]|uniref:Response regulator n=1 Tax=Flavobacterium pectinovorum TaxID=29533 RepID=A0A502EE67_9FLAO|nr:response regulator [Flavobacterium pectinovorum]